MTNTFAVQVLAPTLCLLPFCGPLAAQSDRGKSAWDVLLLEEQDILNEESITNLEKRVLHSFSLEQIGEYLEREPASEIFSVTRQVIDRLLATKTPEGTPSFAITWYSVAGGGGTLGTANTFQLGGTIGQPDTSMAQGIGCKALIAGGFWAFLAPSAVFCDGFEAGDFSAWDNSVSG